MSKHKRIRVAITCGDINGIGLEVILKTLTDARVYEHCVPVIYASEDLVNSTIKALGLEGIHVHVTNDSEKLDPVKINVLNVWKEHAPLSLGQVTPEGGKYAFASLKSAVSDIASNKMDVLVTAPINKANIQSSEFKFPGHTEYLAAYANEENPLMILVHETLRVALVTGHIGVREVTQRVSAEQILVKLRVFQRSLQQDFGIHRPRIAVLGINPHNSDNGLMGDEEARIVVPAIKQASEEKILAFGPFSSDGYFGSTLRSQFDGVLAMYHDQGLGPFKALAFEDGVNFTAGLPIVRTSPDHGTAYDIAGKGVASESSMRSALFAACDIYHQRRQFKELVAKPLPISALKVED